MDGRSSGIPSSRTAGSAGAASGGGALPVRSTTSRSQGQSQVSEWLPSGRPSMASGGTFAPRSQISGWQSQPPQSGYGYGGSVWQGGAAPTAAGGSQPGSGGGFAGGWAESQMGHTSVGVQPARSGAGSAAPTGAGVSMPGSGGGFGGGWAESQMGGSSGGVAASPSMAGSAGGAPSFSQWAGPRAAASQPSAAGSNSGATSAEDLLRSSVRRLYEARNLKVTEDTRPAFTNSDLIDDPTKLGSGAFNTVYAVKLEDSDGKTFDGVFKPLASKEEGWVAHASGIPRDDPQTAMRNLATLAYAEKLGIDVIPDTHLGVLRTEQASTRLGLVMERASGTAAADASANLFSRADVTKEVTKLQLLDHLTGQGDRHGGNYFIDAGSDYSAKVTGIDNDQAFGSKLTRPDDIKYAKDSAHIGYRGTSLPPAVDRKTANAITALSSGDIREMLGDKLSGSEVQAAISRHRGVTAHIADLSEQGRVIDSRPWWQLGLGTSKWATSSVQRLFTADNSYVGRDREIALARQARDRTQGATQP